MDSIRQQKVSRLLQKELGKLFQKDLKHLAPGQIVTVTAVGVSPDLSYARVYISIFPTKEPQKVVDTFTDHVHEIKRLLVNTIRHDLRIMPGLQFYHDDSLDHAERIESLLS